MSGLILETGRAAYYKRPDYKNLHRYDGEPIEGPLKPRSIKVL